MVPSGVIRTRSELEDHLLPWLFGSVLETSHPYSMPLVFAGAKGHHTKVSMV